MYIVARKLWGDKGPNFSLEKFGLDAEKVATEYVGYRNSRVTKNKIEFIKESISDSDDPDFVRIDVVGIFYFTNREDWGNDPIYGYLMYTPYYKEVK